MLCTRPTEDAEMRRVRGGRSVVRRLGAFTTATLAAAVLLAAGPAAASAAQFHAFSTTLAAPGSGDGQLSLSSPQLKSFPTTPGSGLAVDDATGDLYVADTGNHRVDQFSSSGAFIRAFGADVGGPGVDVCATGCGPGTTGSEPGALEAPAFVAVDNSTEPSDPSKGDVYVATGVGRDALNEIQTVIPVNATGGSFTLTFEGQTTSSIAYDSKAEVVKEDLEALSTIGAGNVIVEDGHEGSKGFGEAGGWTIHFVDALALTDVPQLTADTSSLTPPAATAKINTQRTGSPFVPELISKFTSTGDLIETWGDNGPGETSNGQLVGPPGERFSPADGIAVDASGNLWVSAGVNGIDAGKTNEFDQSGAFEQSWPDVQEQAAGIAVDPAQDLYLSANHVEKYTSGGTFLGYLTESHNFSGPLVVALAVDPAHDDLYLDQEGASIADLSPQCVPDTNGFAHGCTPTQVFGAGHLSPGAGLAIDSGPSAANGTLYAADTGTDRIDVFPATLEATIDPASAILGPTATLNGKVDPEGAQLSSPCEFEYGTTKNYGKVAECEQTPAAIGSGAAPVPVSAKLAGLPGNTTIHFRLRAVNPNGKVRSEDEALTTPTTPRIGELVAVDLTPTSATLTAKINPEGLPVTDYHFEYDTIPYVEGEAPHGTEVPLGGGEISTALSSDHAVEAPLEHLSPDTTYYFRLLATDANGTTTSAGHDFVYSTAGPPITQNCSNEALRAEDNSTQLPDCRAYEMVSPDYTEGFPFDRGTGGDLETTPYNENVFTEQTFGVIGGADNDKDFEAEYQATRTPQGWQSAPLDPPASQFPENSPSVIAFSSDLRSQIERLGAAGPYGATPTPEEQFYLRDPAGHFTAIGPAAPHGTLGEVNNGHELVESFPVGASADLSHLLFEASVNPQSQAEPFWPGDRTIVPNTSLYEYAGTANSAPTMVAVTGGPGSHELITQCGSGLGARGVIPTKGPNALSANGATAFFTALPGGCEGYDSLTGEEETGAGPPVAEIYARLHASETLAISEPTHADCEACQEGSPAPATFLAASEDGSKLIFSTAQQLLPADTDETTDIYEYDFAAPAGHRITQLSAGVSGDPTPGAGAEVQGLVSASPDLSRVYFVAQGVLAGPNAEGRSPIEGQPNLYLAEPDLAEPAHSRTAFLATLIAGACNNGTCGGDAGDWHNLGVEGGSLRNLTPDGRHLLFASQADLTPDDTSAAAQLFQYDSATERLARVSVGQNGYDDNGNGAVAIGPLGGYQSEDGSRVFFDSTVPLVPAAAASAGFNSVYEWQADGAGACAESQGCVYLISDGHDTHGRGTTLAGVTPTGSDVYFETSDQLLPADTNTQLTVYDARAQGGFPAATESTECHGDPCQGEKSPAPTATGPATPNFHGPENPQEKPPKPCKKGFVKKHGHCVKQPSKHHRHKKHHKRAANTNRRAGK